tara:strand:+ start:1841 stop:3136 length:1296 start_codon:yes stop_codon:yes gene_type:complete
MNCKRGYTQAYIIENLNRSFNDTDFKKHRKKLILDSELSRMPETMQAAENYKKIEEHNTSLSEINKQLCDLNKQMQTLKLQRQKEHNAIHCIKSGKNPEEQDKKKFIFPCPNTDCRGYLSTQYKCEICKLYTCPHCHELIGHNRDDPHTCNPDSVASAEEIKKTSKGCPSCGVRIQKISGCDQMYCTECRVAFSWNTGKLVTGPIHNPHYYQLMAKENNGTATRNPQDILCGGLITYYTFNIYVIRKVQNINSTKYTNITPEIKKSIETQLITLHRTINHITNYEVPRYRTLVNNLNDNQELRIQYINAKISKEYLGAQAYRNNQKRKKTMDILQIYELLSVVGIENFTALANSKSVNSQYINEINAVINTITNLIKYTNREMKLISITYNNKVMIIKPNFEMDNKKFLQSDMETILKENNGAGSSTDPIK